MYAVIFEVTPTSQGKEEYLKIAAQLRDMLKDLDGFISIERFQSLVDDEKILSLSFWRDENAIAQYRAHAHRDASAPRLCASPDLDSLRFGSRVSMPRSSR